MKVDADPGGISRETAEIHRNAQQTILESVDTAGSRLYTQHKTSISTTREFGREDRVTRKVTNTNRCHPVTYLFFEVLPGTGKPKYPPVSALKFHTAITSKYYGEDYAVENE